MSKITLNDEREFADEFAYKVRQALDEGIEAMPKKTTDRLLASRQMAMARKKAESPVLVTERLPRLAGDFSSNLNQRLNDSLNSASWMVRLGIIIPLLILVLGFIGIVHDAQERRIDDLAEIDAAVLADELPIDAYLDHGFDSYLSKISKGGD